MLEIFHVKYQQGSGGHQVKHLQANRETFKTAKRSLRIQNDFTLCLPRAIVVARMHAQKPSDTDLLPTWNREWDRRAFPRAEKNRPWSLWRALTAISIHIAGLTNGKNLQRVLAPEYRLKIFQFKKGARRLTLEPVYKGLGTRTCLNVLLDEEHYDTILSMPGVLGCPYYCHYCDVGYRNIEDHPVPTAAVSVLPITPVLPTGHQFTALYARDS